MKLTLLEIVQDILNDMDGDNVNSINDTIESQQVAQIVKTCYLEIMATRNWPHMRTSFVCTAYGNDLYPTTLIIPENIKKVESIRYNKLDSTQVYETRNGVAFPTVRDKYEELEYLQPDDFLSLVHQRDSTASNISAPRISGLLVQVYNDRHPQYWTSFNDTQIICDAWNNTVEDTLQTGNNMCVGIRNPDWSHADSSIPELPAEAFPALLEEAKSTAFYALRQVANEKAEQKATRNQRWLARNAWRAKGGIRLPNYGRRKAFSGYEKNPLLDKG